MTEHAKSRHRFGLVMTAVCIAFAVVLAGMDRVSADEPMLKLEQFSKVPGGVLARSGDRYFMVVAGTPEQMGTAHGRLMKNWAQELVDRVVYGVGGAESIMSGEWFIDTSAEIYRRTSPHIPERFIRECDAMSRAAGISVRDGRYANLFPERFHCSGIAVAGKATKNGQVVHARVLDYMRDIGLQRRAVTIVYIPEGYNAWLTQSYAGLVGTVTAMNDKHLAMGEIGGRGEGDWDGMPMTFLMRDVMERADSVERAIEIIKQTPRTCEYYYVLSDKSGAMAALHCTKDKVEVLRPGDDHPDLPPIPEDTIIISGGDRARVAAERINQYYGTIDAETMIEIIKRPVAMRSNLHDAIFLPEKLEMWAAEAGRNTPACDEPYIRCSLPQLIEYYRQATEQ